MYQISNTSIQTLRYYDNLDLLKPKTIGKYNGYRYYTSNELTMLKIIKRLKGMGFKLKDISKMLNRYDEKLLILRKKELQSNVDSNLKSIKEIEGIIKKMKNQKLDFQKELVNLINREERREIGVKERYDNAKEKLSECYELYQNNNFDECLISLEELKNDIFNATEEIDPFWVSSAGDLFSGIAFEVIKNNKQEEVTLLNIFQFRISGKEYMEDLIEYTKGLSKDSYSYISLSTIISMPDETKISIISVFRQKMKLYAMFEAKK